MDGYILSLDQNGASGVVQQQVQTGLLILFTTTAERR
jgi:hypothetical protein